MSKKTSKLLGRAAILGASDRKVIDIAVPEWGGSVRIREMSLRQRNDYVALAETKSEYEMILALMCFCLIDETGDPLFNEDDLTAIAEKNAAVIDRIGLEIAKLNGFNAEKN